jgi:hypothetical protein
MRSRLQEDLNTDDPLDAEVQMLIALRQAEEPVLSPGQITEIQGRLRQAIKKERKGFSLETWLPYLLLQAQARLVYRGFWLASALMYLLGFLVSIAAYTPDRGAVTLVLCAPLIAAAGMALLYQTESAQAMEIERAMPVSLPVIILARMTLVFAYDLALALLASLGVWLVYPSLALGSLLSAWFGPMVVLSALAFLVSVLGRNPNGGIIVSMTLWFFYTALRFTQSGGLRVSDLHISIPPAFWLCAAIGLVAAGLWWLNHDQRVPDGGLNG